MALININMPKPRPFNYHPRYYNERKERLEEMKAKARAELAAEKKAAEAGYVGGLQKGFLAENRANSKLYRRKLEKQSTMRFLIILLALCLLFYLWQPDIVRAIFGIK
jgi:hypothetical protein